MHIHFLHSNSCFYLGLGYYAYFVVVRVYRKMNRQLVNHVKKITVGLFFLALIGCSGSDVKPTVEVGNQFKLGHVSLKVSQRIAPKIIYHSESELQQLLAQKVSSLLEQRGLLSHQPKVNALVIQVAYQRHFLDEQTAHSSDALAYPRYDYDIKVMNGDTELTHVTQKNRVFKGRFIMNIDMLAGRLKHKSDEIVFIERLAKEIVRSVVELKS